MKFEVQPLIFLTVVPVVIAYIVAISKSIPIQLQLVKHRHARVNDCRVEASPTILYVNPFALTHEYKGLPCPIHHPKQIWAHWSPKKKVKKN